MSYRSQTESNERRDPHIHPDWSPKPPRPAHEERFRWLRERGLVAASYNVSEHMPAPWKAAHRILYRLYDDAFSQSFVGDPNWVERMDGGALLGRALIHVAYAGTRARPDVDSLA